jgi:hypothetical protein
VLINTLLAFVIDIRISREFGLWVAMDPIIEQSVKKVSNEGSVTCKNGQKRQISSCVSGAMSKRFGPLRFKGSTQEKSTSEIFGFGYRKAEYDKKVPDRVGSEVTGAFVLRN